MLPDEVHVTTRNPPAVTSDAAPVRVTVEPFPRMA
jgi:hypothetical protein